MSDFPYVLNIPDSAWKPTGHYINDGADPAAQLKVTILVNDTPMHLEAYAIEYRDHRGNILTDAQIEEFQEFGCEPHLVDKDADEAMGRLIGDTSYPPKITTIAGRGYVLIATPYGD